MQLRQRFLAKSPISRLAVRPRERIPGSGKAVDSRRKQWKRNPRRGSLKALLRKLRIQLVLILVPTKGLRCLGLKIRLTITVIRRSKMLTGELKMTGESLKRARKIR